MNYLILITSVINTSNNRLSYTPNRSIYTPEERYNQTMITILSVKKYIPNSKILFVECSDISYDYEKNIINNTDIFINLSKDNQTKKYVDGISKSLGEGIMTIKAIEFIYNNNIQFDNLIKISGRYYLNNIFNIESFNNNYIAVKTINNDFNNIFTCLYKIPYKYIDILYNFLKKNIILMINCIGYEILFGIFLKEIDSKQILYIDKIGINGYVSVSNEYYDG